VPDTRSLLFLTGATFLAIGGVMGLGGTNNSNQNTCTNDCETPPISEPAQANSTDVDTLARTIWGEARGEGYDGMQAVANVVMNRVHAGTFPGGYSITGVCRAPRQFSCWNPGDPNLQPMLSVSSSNPQFQTAMQIAQEAVAGTLPDITNGATYYHSTSIATPSSWGDKTQVASIGNQVFYT
jgi:N-acetylmuramoyl-L-alanine amidase